MYLLSKQGQEKRLNQQVTFWCTYLLSRDFNCKAYILFCKSLSDVAKLSGESDNVTVKALVWKENATFYYFFFICICSRLKQYVLRTFTAICVTDKTIRKRLIGPCPKLRQIFISALKDEIQGCEVAFNCFVPWKIWLSHQNLEFRTINCFSEPITLPSWHAVAENRQG